MKVVIPVAGIGSRLRPHTHTAPKALLYVAGKPLLGHILDSLLELDFTEITFVTGVFAEQIIDYVEKSYDFNARFVHQEELLGLGFAMNLAIEPGESEELLIILGDTIVETSWKDFIGQGRNLLGVKPVADPRRFGVAQVQGNRIIRLWEKPESPPSNLAAVGVYYIRDTLLFKSCLEQVIAQGIKTKNEFQVTDAFQLLIDKGVGLYPYEIDGWYDCGKSETLLETNRHLLESCRNCREIPGSVVVPPSFVDESAEIENSVIGPYASVAADVKIRNSVISNSIISHGATVINGLLEGSLVGNDATVVGTFKRLNVGDSSEISY